ncbi:MAG TPA: sensor histidine kinase [Solirubrobacterales bacterium]
MVDNLLANAIAYNESSGRVWVSVEEVGAEQLRLTVSNSGPRVDPAGVADLFEPFVRAEPSRSRRSGGAGLGLAIVRAVAVAHGGGARAEARPEGGMTVTVVVSREI